MALSQRNPGPAGRPQATAPTRPHSTRSMPTLPSCALAQLTTDKQRIDAHRFYERLGYRATHEGYKLPL